MWNDILKANEEGNLHDAIEKIKQEDGGKFWKHIQSTFLNEYHDVIAIEKDDDYKFPYEPSLMQKLMVYYLSNNKSFGNWCGTGAGKTNAFLFETPELHNGIDIIAPSGKF